jgi:hypothetical protein
VQVKGLGSVIAQRELLLDGKAPVDILIGQPYFDQRTGNCICPYQIKGMGDERVHRALGADEFEAIGHAILLLGARLRASDEAARLSWNAGSFKGDLGLPAWPPDTDLVRLCGPKANDIPSGRR